MSLLVEDPLMVVVDMVGEVLLVVVEEEVVEVLVM